MPLYHKAPSEGAACIQQHRGGCSLCPYIQFSALNAGLIRIAGTPALAHPPLFDVSRSHRSTPPRGGGGVATTVLTRALKLDTVKLTMLNTEPVTGGIL
jgi:hypothetical protein